MQRDSQKETGQSFSAFQAELPDIFHLRSATVKQKLQSKPQFSDLDYQVD